MSRGSCQFVEVRTGCPNLQSDSLVRSFISSCLPLVCYHCSAHARVIGPRCVVGVVVPMIGMSSSRFNKKKMHNKQGRHISPFKVHREYIAKCPFVHVHVVSSRTCVSYAEKIEIW
jgi:hypothetical protein